MIKAGNKMELTKDGQSNYEIVLSSDAIPSEKTAVTELRDYIQKISDVVLPVVNTPSKGKKQILTGWSPEVSALLPEINFKKLKPDEIIIKSFGNKLVLSGSRPRGTLYAVYTFLEDMLGVAWWTPEDSYVPKTKNIIIDKPDIRYAPIFQFRDVYYWNAYRNAQFSTRLKINGHFSLAKEELGGHQSIIGFCHTFDFFIPAKKYFETHPEWFRYANGKRWINKRGTQLCLSNDAMFNEFMKNLSQTLAMSDDVIRQVPTLFVPNFSRTEAFKTIAVGQNDNGAYCRCDKCATIDSKEGSHSGSLLMFVNKVADALEKQSPGTQIETLAYQYTSKPPQNIRPRENITIRLCADSACFSKPFDSNANAELRENIIVWSKIAPHLAFWNYTVNFSNQLIPHPNISNFANDMRFLAKNNVTAIFAQGGSGYFTDLKAWLLSKLLWNPQLDQKELIRQFLQGRYKKAATYLEEYLYLMESEVAKSGYRLSMDERDPSCWLSVDAMEHATKLFDQAELQVKNDPQVLKEVKKARLSLDLAWICIGKVPQSFAGNFQEFRGEFIRNAEYLKIKKFETYITLVKEQKSDETIPLPKNLKQLVGKEYHDFQPDQFNIFNFWRLGEACFKVDDKAASNQRAVRMPGDHGQWAVQCFLPGVFKGNATWEVFAMVRCEAAKEEGLGMIMGVYNPKMKKHITSKDIPAKEINGSEYKLISLGTVKLNAGTVIWACPPNNQNVKNVWLDRIIISKK